MKKLLLLITPVIAISCFAQDKEIKDLSTQSQRSITKDPHDTIPKVWKVGGMFSLNVSQGSLSNWAAGGEDFSLALTNVDNLFAFYKKGRYSWDNTLDVNIGYVKTTSLGSRKNDDRFDLFSKYGYALTPKLNLAGLFDFRSQFFKGYTYEDDVPKYASNFMSPGYVLLSAGLDWKPVNDLSIFFSPVTARWVFVTDNELSNQGLYGVPPGENSNFEFGAYVSISYLKEFNKVLAYKGRLDLFSNYRHNPQNVDLYMTNVLSVRISKVLSATWGLDLIYDDDTKLFGPTRSSPALQVKSLVGVGLLVRVGYK
jgi:hypothetical protein